MIATIVGVIGIGANMLIYQQKSDKKLLMYKMISDFLWALHYMLIDAYSACLIAAINIFREIVFYNNDKKWAKSPVWLGVFIVISAVAGIVTWVDWYSFLPSTAMILTTVSYWLKSETKIRLVTFPSSPCWLVYNIITHSIAL